MKKWMWFLVICWITFIFYNSSLTGKVSTSNSDTVAKLVDHFFKTPVSWNSGLTFVIRKLAHFLEYFMLGSLVWLSIQISPIKTKLKYLVFILLLLIPVIDEWIQYFTPNRSALISDMILDHFGYISGILFAILILNLRKRRRKSSCQIGI